MSLSLVDCLSDITLFGVLELRDKIKKKEIKSKQAVEAFIDAIEKSNLNAVVVKNFENALKLAEDADKLLAEGGECGRLHGVPFLSKSLFCIDGIETNSCSNILRDFKPNYDATVIAKLKAEGAIVLGQTNMDEFAMGSANEHSCYGAAINPWKSNQEPNKNLIAGGSSGGSAASIASFFAPFALGSDTGGSVRQPAAMCGLVGFRTTYGLCSRWGMIPLANSLDQAGVLTRSVKDNAFVTSVIMGKDDKDPSSLGRYSYEDMSTLINPNIKGLKIGLVKEYSIENSDPCIINAFEECKKLLESLGAKFIEISLPLTELALQDYLAICSAEVFSALSRYDGIRYGQNFVDNNKFFSFEDYCSNLRFNGFGNEAKRRISLGAYSLFCKDEKLGCSLYEKALLVKESIKLDFLNAWSSVDVILSPTSPNLPYEIGQKLDPIKVYYNDVYTIPSSMAGMPSINIPFGLSDDGLPMGMHIIGQELCEQKLFDIGFAIEEHKSNECLNERLKKVEI